jgi:hypothetical protein
MRSIRSRSSSPPTSAFVGFRFPPDVIVVAIRWYLRFNLSYRDVEELLVERGVQVGSVALGVRQDRRPQVFLPRSTSSSDTDFANRDKGELLVRREAG